MLTARIAVGRKPLGDYSIEPVALSLARQLNSPFDFPVRSERG